MSENNHYPKFEFMTSPAAENKVHTIYIEKAKQVVPVIFIPGVMGSNLRAKSQSRDDKKVKTVWLLNSTGSPLGWAMPGAGSAKVRRKELDPAKTDVYYGGKVVDATEKDIAKIEQEYRDTVRNLGDYDLYKINNAEMIRKKKIDDAIKNNLENKLFGTRRQRGWGTVGYISYGKFLEDFQQRLFSANGGLPADFINLMSPPSFTLDDGSKALLTFKQAHIDHCKNFHFPVYAMGYNWLQSNEDSAKALKTLVEVTLPKYYKRRMPYSALGNNCSGPGDCAQTAVISAASLPSTFSIMLSFSLPKKVLFTSVPRFIRV